MHYHIILTERCNLHCTYCYGKSMEEFDNGLGDKWDYDMETPTDSEVNVERLKKFVKPSDTLIFYGGEPLVMLEKMEEIIDDLDCHFMIQTNGILLNQLPTEYLLKLDKMLVSIDGTPERTNLHKGKAKYEIITNNLKDIRDRGYKGEIVARMVITESDLYEQVMHLIGLIEVGLYDSIHWQIDAEFYKNDYDKEKFSKFVKKYNASIDKLLDWWFGKIKAGNIVKLYPFLGILNRIKGWDKEIRLPCGAGYANFTINTKGDLSACPIMNSVKNMYCGSINEGVTKEINCGNWCSGCDYFNICGGRCLYSNYAQLWPREGFDLVCSTIKHLIDGIRSRAEGLELNPKDFEFEKYFGPEIIP